MSSIDAGNCNACDQEAYTSHGKLPFKLEAAPPVVTKVLSDGCVNTQGASRQAPLVASSESSWSRPISSRYVLAIADKTA